MDLTKKTVGYAATNTYETLNQLTPKTEYVWLVFHGIGYLSQYFLKHFKTLDPEKNYIIAPQAPSKYYLNKTYTYVGASWLTKEDTQAEIKNVVNYTDAVFAAEAIPATKKLIVFGFSQGVSIAMRWAVRRKLPMEQLVLYAGGIPREINETDMDFIFDHDIKVKVVYGTNDEFLNAATKAGQQEKLQRLFRGRAEIITFEGGHEMKEDVIKNLLP